MKWRNDKATDGQIKAIGNMTRALGMRTSIPETKGEACDLIKVLKEKMSTVGSKGFPSEQENGFDLGYDASDYPGGGW